MVIDEPTLWASIPEDRREAVERMAKAMCRQSSKEDGEEHGPCGTPESGSCVAFGLYGGMAWAAMQTTEG